MDKRQVRYDLPLSQADPQTLSSEAPRIFPGLLLFPFHIVSLGNAVHPLACKHCPVLRISKLAISSLDSFIHQVFIEHLLSPAPYQLLGRP